MLNCYLSSKMSVGSIVLGVKMQESHGRREREEDYDDYEAEESLARKKLVLLVLNGLVFLLALVNFAMCLWVRFDLDFAEWVWNLNWYSYWNCMYVILTAMVLVILTTLLHTYALLMSKPDLFVWTSVLYLISWLLEVVGSILIILYGMEESDILVNELRDVFLDLVHRSHQDHRANRILKIIQEIVECCGSNGCEDYIDYLKPVPYECRHPVTGGEFANGCNQELAWWLEPWTATLASISLFFVLAHVVQVVLGLQLRKSMKQEEYRPARNHDY